MKQSNALKFRPLLAETLSVMDKKAGFWLPFQELFLGQAPSGYVTVVIIFGCHPSMGVSEAGICEIVSLN